MDTIQVKEGDVVKRGDLLGRQGKEMATTKYAKNIHLHFQFPSKRVLIEYIEDLVNNTMDKNRGY